MIIFQVTATLVAKQFAAKNEEGVQDALCQALVVGTFIAITGSIFILTQPDRLLGGVLAGMYYLSIYLIFPIKDAQVDFLSQYNNWWSQYYIQYLTIIEICLKY